MSPDYFKNMMNQELNKGISTPLGVAIIVLIAILAGGILAWQGGLIEKISTSTPTPTPTPNETADWQTYTNEKYWFEIKYPNNYEVVIENDETGLLLVHFINPQNIYYYNIIVTDKTKTPKFSNFISNPESYEHIKVENYNNVEWDINWWTGGTGVDKNPISAYTTNEKHIFEITLDSQTKAISLERISQRLSTFKFLELDFILPKGMEQWKIGETHTVKINQPVKDFYPFTHLTLNKPNGKEIGIISCKIGGSGEIVFNWDTKTVLNYCGAGLEEKIKEIEPGNYMVAIAKDIEGRPIIATSELFSIISK